MRTVVVIVAALASASPLFGQVRLSIAPTAPAPGAIVRVAVRGAATADSITGTMGGERLHFERDSAGVWRSFGPVPVDASRGVTARAFLHTASRVDTVTGRVAVPEIKVASSKLSVAPRFSQPMDSALTARVADENRRARAVGEKSHSTPRLWTRPFLKPRESVVTSPFGSGRVFNGVVTSRHLGVDFRGGIGDEVRATNRGVVALVDTFHLAGRLVYVDHGQGVVTAYFHLSEALVAPGDTVERGQLIGRVGETGRVTGPHLHWAARYGSQNVNPLDLVALTRD